MRTRELFERPRMLRGRLAAMSAALGMLLMSAGVVTLGASNAAADTGQDADAGDFKVAICHATGSASNPYENGRGEIPKQAITSGIGHGSDHANHPRDIIPAFPAGSHGGHSWDAFAGRNWDAEGQAIYYNDCGVPSASPSVTPSSTVSATSTATATATNTATETVTATNTATETVTATNTATATVSPHPTGQPTGVPTGKPTETDKPTGVPTGKPTVKPTEATDVCPNLDGVQSEVPKGHVKKGTKCVKPQVAGTHTSSPQPDDTATPGTQPEGDDTDQPGINPVSGGGGGPVGLPTAVDAGLGQPGADGSLAETLARSMMGAGLLLLLAAGWLQTGRRPRGAHQF